MRGNFEECFALTLKEEGGFVNDPHDPGGITNLGVTLAAWRDYCGRGITEAEMRRLTPAKVAPFYEAEHWTPIRGDELPSGVDLALYDWGVNSGASRAVIGLQRILHVADDGKLGPITIKEAQSWDASTLVRALSLSRVSFLQRLSTWPRYGKGWSWRVDRIQAAALRMSQPKETRA